MGSSPLGQGLVCLLFHLWLLRAGLGVGSSQPGLSIHLLWELLEGTVGPKVMRVCANWQGGI